jgi:uncharacterized SAM-binding protein YcdF (DUF218 family)
MEIASWQVAFAQTLVASLGAIISGGLLWWSLHRDPRPLRNGFLAVIATYGVLGLVSFVAAKIPVVEFAADLIRVAVLVAGAVGLLLLPVILTVNGILMARREHRSLGNLLSLLAGIALLILPLIVVWLISHENTVTGTIAVGLLTAQACLGLLFLIFVAHTALYAVVARRAPARAVIVLGSGLVAGQVPPLLAGRLQQALTAAHQRQEQKETSRRIPIVPSGGQGADESRSEGEAMAEWLREHGVPDRDILVEDQARTTEENLRYSAGLLQRVGIDPPYLIVTNNYHAPPRGNAGPKNRGRRTSNWLTHCLVFLAQCVPSGIRSGHDRPQTPPRSGRPGHRGHDAPRLALSQRLSPNSDRNDRIRSCAGTCPSTRSRIIREAAPAPTVPLEQRSPVTGHPFSGRCEW